MEPTEEYKKPANTEQDETKENGTEEVDPAFSDKVARKLLGEGGEFNAKQLQAMSKAIASGKLPPNLAEYEKQYKELTKSHPFWDTQPVPKLLSENNVEKDGELDTLHDLAAVPKDPYPLLEQFEWSDVDLHNQKHLDELYTFLYENYVEDEDGMFRFDYSRDFLVWALTQPGYHPEWLIGVRVKKSQKLVGFISGIPVHLNVNQSQIKMAEINFLCVHKKLRANRLSPVLIKEVTRRVHLKDQWQIYTAGKFLPTPIVQAKYYHRSLNPKKLIEVKFSSLPKNSTMSRTVKLYKLPEEPVTPGIRLMKKKDVGSVYKLLTEYLKKFNLYLKYTKEDIEHWFMPREKVVTTYVVEKDKKITDMISYYSLPSSILQSPKHDRLNAAYSFYNVATSVSFKDLMYDALILAAKDGYDVFNALDILDNGEVFSELKFSVGDGNLHYYLYNWGLSKELKPSQVGIVLL